MTKDEIIRMAREAGYSDSQDWSTLVRFSAIVADYEREECAKVCDQLSSKHTWEGCYANECAEEIRARGKK